MGKPPLCYAALIFVCEKSVAEVQAGRRSALSIASPGAARMVGMLRFHGDDFNADIVQPQVQFAAAGLAKTSLYHHRCLKHRGGGNQSYRIFCYALLKGRRFRFVEGNGDDG